VEKEWEGRGGVTGRHRTEVSRRAAASVSRVSTKDFFSFSSPPSLSSSSSMPSGLPVEPFPDPKGELWPTEHCRRSGAPKLVTPYATLRALRKVA